LLDGARDGLFALDANGVIIDVNTAGAAHLGRARVFLIGKPFVSFVPLAGRRAFRSALLHLTPAQPATVELELGVERSPVTAQLRLIADAGARTVALTLAAAGAAALPAAAAVPAPDHHVERMFLRFPYAAIGIRGDLRVAWANHHARRLLGRDAVRSGRLLAPRQGLDLRPIAERLVSVPVPLAPAEMELDDGRVIRVAGVAAHAEDPAVIFLEDVTTKRLQDRVMREFVRNAAHQLRTPLTGITSAVEVLQSGAKESPADRDRFLSHVEQHAARLTRMAHGLLVLARAQAGEVVRLDFVELRPLLEALAAAADPAPEVAVEVSCPTSLAALADGDLLREALASMVENAVTHTHEGSIVLRAFDGDGRVTIQVSDTGAGILPEHLNRIFEPFYRGDGTGQGFGLGLAIAAQALRAMDGELLVMGDPGGGTTFSVRLPSARIVQ